MPVLYTKVGGWGEDGNQQVNISGLLSSTKIQRSYPNCTITVYNAGTLTLTTIYSDNSGTPLANPFTAANSGQWTFFAAPLTHVDITFSGGGIAAPFTLSDVIVPILTGIGAWTYDGTTFIYPNPLTARVLVGAFTTTDTGAGQGQLVAINGVTAANTNTNAVLTTIQSAGGGSGAARLISDKSGTQGYVPLAFLTNGAEQMRILASSNANVLIGATSTDATIASSTLAAIGNNAELLAIGAVTNASIAGISVTNGSYVALSSGRSNAGGTYLPLAFFTSGNEAARYTLDPFWQLTTSYSGGNLSAAGAVALRNHSGVLEKSENGGAWTAIASGGGITGSGTTNTVAKWTGSSVLGNSGIGDDGNTMTFSTASVERARWISAGQLLVGGTSTDLSLGTSPLLVTLGNGGGFVAASGSLNASLLGLSIVTGNYASVASNISGTGTYLPLAFFSGGGERMRLNTSGQLYFGNTSTDLSLGITASIVTLGNNSGFVMANATTNASYFRFSMAGGVAASLNSSRTGSGTFLPIVFYTSDQEQMRLLTGANANLLLGGASTDATITSSTVATIGNGSEFLAMTATTNSSIAGLSIVSGSYASLASTKSGTGTFLPLAFFVNGGEVARFPIATGVTGSMLLGATSVDFQDTPAFITVGNNSGFVAAGATTNSSLISLIVTNTVSTSINSGRSGSGTYLKLEFDTGGAARAYLGTTGLWQWLAYGAGTLVTDASGNITASSDERLKDVLGDLNVGIVQLRTIHPIRYKWKAETGYDTESTYAGFSAQKVKEVFPEAVGENKDGTLTLQDRALMGLVINAIKDIDYRLSQLEAR